MTDPIVKYVRDCEAVYTICLNRQKGLFVVVVVVRLLELNTRIIIEGEREENESRTRERQHKGESAHQLRVVSHCTGETKNAKRTHTCTHAHTYAGE